DRDGVPVSRGGVYPVVSVNWDDAQGFCSWLTKRDLSKGTIPSGARYRLPTDEEWSAAVGLPAEKGNTPAEKATENREIYPWGNHYPPTGEVGNYADESFHKAFPPNGDAREEYKQNKWLKGYTDHFATTSPVGSYPANPFGLYDMGGN